MPLCLPGFQTKTIIYMEIKIIDCSKQMWDLLTAIYVHICLKNCRIDAKKCPDMPRKAFRKQGSGHFGNTETEEYAEHPWAEKENAKHAVVPRHAIFHFGPKQTCD